MKVVGHDTECNNGELESLVCFANATHKMVFILLIIVDIRTVVSTHNNVKVDIRTPVPFSDCSRDACSPPPL